MMADEGGTGEDGETGGAARGGAGSSGGRGSGSSGGPSRPGHARTSPGRRRPGRPRSGRVHRAILAASLELLEEVGWDGLTMEGIARQAGVSKATLYRRWTRRETVLRAAIELVAVELSVGRETPPETGSVRTDLLATVERVVADYRGALGGVLPGLLAAQAADAELAAAVRSRLLEPQRSAFRQVLERGIERGEVRSDADLDTAVDLLVGPLIYRRVAGSAASGEGAAVAAAFASEAEVARAAVDVVLVGVASR